MAKFMVTIKLPEYFTPEYVALIPKQRAMIVELLAKGKISSFSLNRDRSHAWMVATSKDEDSLMRMLERFPMHDYFSYEFNELIMHDTEFMGLPKLALN